MEHGKDNLCFASNMDMHGHPAVGANLQSPSEGEYGTDPGSWYHIVAQRYAMQYVKAKIPHVHMHDLLQFFYHLLGDMVLEILQEDLHMHADAVFMLMCWWTCRMDDTLASEGELVSVQVF